MRMTLKYAVNNIVYIETNASFIKDSDLLNAKVRPHAYDCEIRRRLGDFTRRLDVKEKDFYSGTIKETKDFIAKIKKISKEYYVRTYKVNNVGDKYCYAKNILHCLIFVE